MQARQVIENRLTISRTDLLDRKNRTRSFSKDRHPLMGIAEIGRPTPPFIAEPMDLPNQDRHNRILILYVVVVKAIVWTRGVAQSIHFLSTFNPLVTLSFPSNNLDRVMDLWSIYIASQVSCSRQNRTNSPSLITENAI